MREACTSNHVLFACERGYALLHPTDVKWGLWHVQELDKECS